MDQPAAPRLSRAWRPARTHRGAYTGGTVAVSPDEAQLVCMCSEDVSFLDVDSARVAATLQGALGERAEPLQTFALHPSGATLAAVSTQELLSFWDLAAGAVLRQVRLVNAVRALCMAYDPSGTLVAVGCASGAVMVVDANKGFITHNLRGHQGVVTRVRFAPGDSLRLLSCSEDSDVRVWDLQTSKCVANLADHVSRVVDVAFLAGGRRVVTGGHDKVLNVWAVDANNKNKFRLVLTKPTFEQMEALVALDDERVATGGAEGEVRVWRFDEAANRITREASQPVAPGHHVLHLLRRRDELIAVTSEQNFIVVGAADLQPRRTIVGYNDEIVDVKRAPGGGDDVVVATNSSQVRVFNFNDFACDLLVGHEDLVVAVDVSADGQWVATASKDKTARVWRLGERRCAGLCVGHTAGVAAVAFSRRGPAQFLLTASNDRTVKRWGLPTGSDDLERLTAAHTVHAHDKGINALAVAPNSRVLASAGGDKVVKLWSPELELQGVCRGHRRGVWDVQFSPVDRCLVSGSGDRTVKVWSVVDCSCLKTFEGHIASVLRVSFITSGMQLLSAGADGLVKLWTIRGNTCDNTFEAHGDRVWALDVDEASGSMITGGADSVLHVWEDCTAEEDAKAEAERQARLLQEQQLSTALFRKDYLRAVQLAFELEHPLRLHTVFTELINGDGSADGPREGVDAVIRHALRQLDTERLGKCLRFIRAWNTNARHAVVAQRVLQLLLEVHPPERLHQVPGLDDLLNGILAYTERHFARIDRMFQRSFLVDHTLGAMRQLLPGSGSSSSGSGSDSSDGSDSDSSDEDDEEGEEERKAASPGWEKADSDSDSDSGSDGEEEPAPRKRASRKAASPVAASPVAEEEQEQPKPRRSRTRSASREVADEAPAAEPTPRKRKSRKAASPVAEEQEEEEEEQPKPRRSRTRSASREVADEAPAAEPTPRKRKSRKAASPVAEEEEEQPKPRRSRTRSASREVADEAPAAEPTPRKRKSRKAASPVAEEQEEEEEEPKPRRSRTRAASREVVNEPTPPARRTRSRRAK